MKPPGPIAVRASNDAAANVGVHEEGTENHGASIRQYLASVGLSEGAPWCAAFVHYRLQAGAKALGLAWPQAGYPRSGYCPDILNWAKAHGLWIPVATARTFGKPGDLALFWFAAKGRVAHVGIVTGIPDLGTGFRTVEGNTSPGPGVEREGDGVYARRRKWGDLGPHGGFVRLPF